MYHGGGGNQAILMEQHLQLGKSQSTLSLFAMKAGRPSHAASLNDGQYLPRPCEMPHRETLVLEFSFLHF